MHRIAHQCGAPGWQAAAPGSMCSMPHTAKQRPRPWHRTRALVASIQASLPCRGCFLLQISASNIASVWPFAANAVIGWVLVLRGRGLQASIMPPRCP